MNNVIIIVDREVGIYRRFVHANCKRRCAFVINLQGVNLTNFPSGYGVAVCIEKLNVSRKRNAAIRRNAVKNRRNPTVCFVAEPCVNSNLATSRERSGNGEVYRRTGRACCRPHIYTVVPGAACAGYRLAFPYYRTFSKAKRRYVAHISGETRNRTYAVIGHVRRNRAYVAVCTFDIRNVKFYVGKRVKLYFRLVIVKIYVNRVNGVLFKRICLNTLFINDKYLSILVSVSRRTYAALQYRV